MNAKEKDQTTRGGVEVNLEMNGKIRQSEKITNEVVLKRIGEVQ
jgi:hypothetical protein